MKRKVRIERQCLLFVLLALTFVAACSESNVPPPETVNLAVKQPASQNIHANVFLDVSGTMEGFVYRTALQSNYKDAVRQVESVFLAKWPSPTISFYKFARSTRPIDSIFNVTSPDFYRESRFSDATNIHTVFEEEGVCKKDTLSIIITDLVPDPPNTIRLVKKISDKCISKDYSIGIGGFTSRYRGRIRDNENDSLNIIKSSDRPFYIIALGSHANIEEFFNQILKQFNSFASKETMTIFSPAIVEQLLTFSESSVAYRSPNVIETKSIIRYGSTGTTTQNKKVKDKIIQKEKSEDKKPPSVTLQSEVIKQFVVRPSKDTTNTTSDTDIITKLNYAPVQYRVPLKEDSYIKKDWPSCKTELLKRYKNELIVSNTTVEKYNEIKGFEEVKGITNSFYVNAMLCVDKDPSKGGNTPERTKLFLHVGLNTKVLNNGCIYRLTVDIKPADSAFDKTDKWWKTWNLDNNGSIGSKTPNLNLFINTIEGVTIQHKRPYLGSVYFYFKKD
ncbi:MAG: hypothetical protein HQL06_00035 [Nitrospirae bacterium]|nr:hypothetical protein [Nitrospirota bacterium]